MMRNQITRLALVMVAGLTLAVGVEAQTNDWPNRPIKLVVAGPAGAGMDIFARMLAAPLQLALKQAVVVDNKAGANSIIGNDAVAKSAPDGYTFLFTPSSAIAINPILQPKMPYDTQKDLLPIAQIGAAGILLVVNPASGFKNLNDVVSYAKANPGKLVYGSWGNGSTGHLAMEGIKSHYKVFMPHVAYRGTAGVVTDLLANNISVAFTDIASPIPHIRSGKLLAIGATGSARGPALPDVPTVSEQGYKFDTDGWYGIFAPAGTPVAIARRMNEEINRILATEEMKQKFRAQNMLIPAAKSADQFASTVKADIDTWQAIAKRINLKID
jgi:tripartite-type tricarboxylate transporter receptor subunit TctC